MKNLDVVLEKMTGNVIDNKQIFVRHLGSLYYCDEHNNGLLHLVVNSDGTISQKKHAIMTLLFYNANINQQNDQGDTFIHTAIKKYVGTNINNNKFVMDVLCTVYLYDFDVNLQNNDGKNIFQLYVESVLSGSDTILDMINWLKRTDFNFDAYDKKGYNSFTYINRNPYLPSAEKYKLKALIRKENDVTMEKRENNLTNNEDKKEDNDIQKYGILLTSKAYEGMPAIGREDELFKIIITLATEKKLPLLVGLSGVGKTTIVDGLAYMIQNDKVPSFLKGKKIIEVLPSNIVAGTKYRGDFENNLREILKYCKDNDAILFIDEFHSIYGTGSSENNKNDMAVIIKSYVDRYKLKVIGATTTLDYDEFLSQDALKRRFEIIKVIEPDRNILYNIVITTIERMCASRNITISEEVSSNMNEIVNILLDLTQHKNLVQLDILCNPDLVVSLIDLACAYALVDEDELKIRHIILGFKDSQKIYGLPKDKAVSKLELIAKQKVEKAKKKALLINIDDYRKDIRK